MNFLSRWGDTLRLSWSFAKFRFKLRNAGSYLGILWYLLDPLAFFVIILLLRENIRSNPIPAYPLYLLMGLIMFKFFMATTSNAIRLIEGNKNFVKSIRIPLESIPLSNIIQFSFSHFFELSVFVALTIFYGFDWRIVLYPLIFIPFALFTAGVSFILATIGIFIEDLKNVWQIFMRLLWLATPIFYSLDSGTLLYTLNIFNPIAQYIELSRRVVVYGAAPDPYTLAVLVVGSAGFFLVGLWVFNKYKRRFGELL